MVNTSEIDEIEVSVPPIYRQVQATDVGEHDLAIEHAPLDARIEQFVCAKALAAPHSGDATSGATVILTDRPKYVNAILDQWGIGGIEVVSHDASVSDLRFNRIGFLGVTGADKLALSTFQMYKNMCRGRAVVAAESRSRDHWFFRWSRAEHGPTLSRLPANEIAKSFPDQNQRLAVLQSTFTGPQKARYLDLIDVDIVPTNLPDYIQWVKQAIPSHCEKPMSRMHIDLGRIFLELCMTRKQKRNVIGPRDSAKSTHCSEGFPLYCICHGLEKYILLISDTTEQACKHLEVIRDELENNEWIAEHYPDVAGAGPVWKNNALTTRNGIRIEALGAGKKIRGRRFQSYRPSLVVCDDLEGDDAAYSSVLREHRRNWFQKGVMKAGSPETNYLIAGSKIHSECVVGHLEVSPGWKTHKYKSIESWPLHMDKWAEWELILQDMTKAEIDPAVEAEKFYKAHEAELNEGAQLLWPEREPLYGLMLMRATDGHAAFEAEKQNNPIDPSKCEWSPDLFAGDIYFDEWPKDLQTKTMSVDPSKGRSDKSGDYSAIVRLGKQGSILYVEADLQRRDVARIVTDLVVQAQLFGPDIVAVEENMHKELLSREIMRVSGDLGAVVPCYPLENTIDKRVRIRRIGPYLNMRCVRFKRRSPGTMLLLRQLQEFPNGDHDDGPDALEMSMRVMSRMLGRRNQMAGAAQTVAMPTLQ